MTSALIVIDVQRALFETSPPPFDAAAVLTRINALADRARAAGAPVIYVQHESPGTTMAHGGAGWDLDTRLTPAEGDIRIRKTTPDSFLRTGLAQVLADAGATHDTPHASGARIRDHHNATLPAISSFGVKIAAVPAAEIYASGQAHQS